MTRMRFGHSEVWWTIEGRLEDFHSSRVSAQVWWSALRRAGPHASLVSPLVSGLRVVVPRLLRARAFVPPLLRPPVLPRGLTGGGAVRRGAAGVEQPSVFQGPGRGRLHDLLTDLADLQLEAHLGGEGVRVARLEGRRGLSCTQIQGEDRHMGRLTF